MVWDESHTHYVNVRSGRARIEHVEERRVWQVHFVGRDVTCVLLTTDCKPAAEAYVRGIFR
jgi:hypothetical protein